MKFCFGWLLFRYVVVLLLLLLQVLLLRHELIKLIQVQGRGHGLGICRDGPSHIIAYSGNTVRVMCYSLGLLRCEFK